MVGGKLPPSLIPVLEFTVTCSHYHCTWYKIPAPGRLGKSFHPSYKLQRHAAFPHNTFFEHWSPFSSLPTQCLIHSVLSAKGQNLKIISLGPMDVFHLYLHYYICSQALNLFKSVHATGLVQALWGGSKSTDFGRVQILALSLPKRDLEKVTSAWVTPMEKVGIIIFCSWVTVKA